MKLSMYEIFSLLIISQNTVVLLQIKNSKLVKKIATNFQTLFVRKFEVIKFALKNSFRLHLFFIFQKLKKHCNLTSLE